MPANGWPFVSTTRPRSDAARTNVTCTSRVSPAASASTFTRAVGQPSASAASERSPGNTPA